MSDATGELEVNTLNQIDRVPLKQYFGIDTIYDDGYGKDLDFIIEWSRESQIKPEDLTLELRKIETRLGQPSTGENRLTKVKNYLRTMKALDSTMKELVAQEQYGTRPQGQRPTNN